VQAQPWAPASALLDSSAALRWGLGLLDSSALRAGQGVALATLRVPSCGNSSSTGSRSSNDDSVELPVSLPWGSALAAGGELHLSLVPPRASGQPNAAWVSAQPPASHPSTLPVRHLSAALQGTGLARTLVLSGAGLPPHPGALALVLTLPATAFLDLDELKPLAHQQGLQLTAFTPYIDIEQPAGASAQHRLVLRLHPARSGQLEGSGGLSGGAFRVALPLHLRHGAPGCAAALRVQQPWQGEPLWAALPTPPHTLFSDGSAHFLGSGKASHFPRYGGCFRLSPAPQWEAFWAEGGGDALGGSSASWQRLQAMGGGNGSSAEAVVPCMVPVGSADDRAAVDAATLGVLAALLCAVALLLGLARQRSGRAKVD
jgi:hypothetical protein